MFNTGSWRTITKLVVKSADLGPESTNSSADSFAIQQKSACGYGPLAIGKSAKWALPHGAMK